MLRAWWKLSIKNRCKHWGKALRKNKFILTQISLYFLKNILSWDWLFLIFCQCLASFVLNISSWILRTTFMSILMTVFLKLFRYFIPYFCQIKQRRFCFFSGILKLQKRKSTELFFNLITSKNLWVACAVRIKEHYIISESLQYFACKYTGKLQKFYGWICTEVSCVYDLKFIPFCS